MNEVLGSKIRYLREALHMTQEDVAEKLNMSRQRYARIEKGICDISYDFILRVSRVLGVESGEITSAVRNLEPRRVEYRNPSGAQPTYDTVSSMLDLFYANKRLFDSVRQGEE